MTMKPSTRAAIELGCGFVAGFAFVTGVVYAIKIVLEFLMLLASFGG